MFKSKGTSHKELKAPVIEAYKTLRTNIQYTAFEKQKRSIMITSPSPEEGKSTTAVNLAIMMAKSESMVLLVDCDLRRPSLHKCFDMANGEGLTNILTQEIDYKKVVNITSTPNLNIITSGPMPPNPPELLGSSRMKNFIDRVMEEYDAVIIDSPPVGLFTDGAVLSRYVDGIVLVVRYGKSTSNELEKTRNILKKVNANILGVVVNKVPVKKRRDNYSYYNSENQ